jgi:hypothetical protein
MTDATLKNALRALVEDLETARDILMAEVSGVASELSDDIDHLDDGVDEIIENGAKGAKPGFLIIEHGALDALRIPSSDPNDEIKNAFRDYDWLVRRALSELRRATLVRETAQ